MFKAHPFGWLLLWHATLGQAADIHLKGQALNDTPRPVFAEESTAMQQARAMMITEQLVARGIQDPATLAAMARVPRQQFVPESLAHQAYRDSPLPIGERQTISQPYIVALMTEVLGLTPEDRVLEVGAGSGYQAAILAEQVTEVVTIEIVPQLARTAAERLKALGYRNITVIEGDGYQGWPEKAPYDAIMVTAAAPHIPQPLLDQLKPGGRLVIPVGPNEAVQQLLLISKNAAGDLTEQVLLPVRFVPLTGDHGSPSPPP